MSASSHGPLLAIDTSGPRLQLALLWQGGLETIVDPLPTGHAEILFDRIAQLLARAGLAYADLQRIAVTTGPGSFTGLRIGLSAARGIALSGDLDVIGVPTLLAVSLSAPQPGPVVVCADARRGEVWFELFPAAGRQGPGPRVLPLEMAQGEVPPGTPLIAHMIPDIAALARFAAAAEPADFPPLPLYVRGADAKPQNRAAVARRSEVGP